MAGASIPILSLGATPVDVCGVPCLLRGKVLNKDAATRYLQLFDLPASSVIAGTTVAKHVSAVRPGVSDPISEDALYFANQVSAIFTTTATGAVAGSGDFYAEVS